MEAVFIHPVIGGSLGVHWGWCGMSGDNKLSVFSATSQLSPEHWDWAVGSAANLLMVDPEGGVDGLRDAGLALGEFLVQRLEAEGAEVEEFHLSIHNRDLLEVWSEAELGYAIDVEPIHVHMVGRFAGGRSGGLKLSAIARALGLAEPQIEKPRRGGRGVEGRSASHDNQLAYLTHIKYAMDWPYGPGVEENEILVDADSCRDGYRWPYSPHQVATVRGEPYIEIHRKRWRDWLVGRAMVVKKKAAEDVDILLDRVIRGEVTLNQLQIDQAMYPVYARHQRRFNDALVARAGRDMALAARDLRQGLFRKSVIWVQGRSEQGKGYLANAVADRLQELTGWGVYRGPAEKMIDDYKGEEIVLMSEPGKDAFKWPDLLTLLDPREAGPLYARYHNKPDVAPRVVIVAVLLDPVEFGFFVPGKRSTDDSIDQLLRRISLMVTAEKIDGEPHYTLAEMMVSRPYERSVKVPGKDMRVHTEKLELSYAGVGLYDYPISHADAVDVVVCVVADRSPDELEAVDVSSLRAVRSALGLPESRGPGSDQMEIECQRAQVERWAVEDAEEQKRREDVEAEMYKRRQEQELKISRERLQRLQERKSQCQCSEFPSDSVGNEDIRGHELWCPLLPDQVRIDREVKMRSVLVLPSSGSISRMISSKDLPS